MDINNADRLSIKAAVQNSTIQTNDLSIEQRKDLIEQYCESEQRDAVFGEYDDITYLKHLITQHFSKKLDNLIKEQIDAIEKQQNQDADQQLINRNSQQIKPYEQQVSEQNDKNTQPTITKVKPEEAQQDNQSIDKNNDIRTLITKSKGSFWERIKTSIKSAIENIKNNKGAILPALAAISFGVIVAGLVFAFATTLPICVGISIACIGIAALISSLSATIVHYYENL